MESIKTYDSFPVRIVILSNLVSILIYSSGIFIIHRIGWIAAALYFAFILVLEYRLLSRHCINCYYWGKTCGFGKGKLSALIFKKGNPADFCSKQMSWSDMIPDLLVPLIPLIIGIILIIIRFDIILLSVIVTIVLLTTAGNGFIRGNLTCRYCRQRELGCPAEKLFNK